MRFQSSGRTPHTIKHPCGDLNAKTSGRFRDQSAVVNVLRATSIHCLGDALVRAHPCEHANRVHGVVGGGLQVRSLIADHFERGRRLEYRESVPEPSWDPWPEEEERQLTERVCEAFGRLPSKDQHSLAA